MGYLMGAVIPTSSALISHYIDAKGTILTRDAPMYVKVVQLEGMNILIIYNKYINNLHNNNSIVFLV